MIEATALTKRFGAFTALIAYTYIGLPMWLAIPAAVLMCIVIAYRAVCIPPADQRRKPAAPDCHDRRWYFSTQPDPDHLRRGCVFFPQHLWQ